MQFFVDYSQEKDIQNYLNAGWKFTYAKYGRENIQERLLQNYPQEFKTKLLQAKTRIIAKKLIKDFLDSRSEDFKRITKLVVKICRQVLNEEKPSIIDLLQKIYQRPFPFEKVTVYITTFPINPYSYEDRWFMVNRNSNIAGVINTTKHELNHFMFYYYYFRLKDKLGVNDFEKLKEALSIFTNPEGNNKPDIVILENFLKSNPKSTLGEAIDLVLKNRAELFKT